MSMSSSSSSSESPLPSSSGLRLRKGGGTSSPTTVIVTETLADHTPKDAERTTWSDNENNQETDILSPFSSSDTKPHTISFQEKSTLEKLFSSKEENHVLHVHKILGFSCLASFVYRVVHIGEQDCNFGPNYGTLFFIGHHFLLNASSFIFQIPPKRIRDGNKGGFRIWPEYRFHSLVFASRSLACMLLIWWEQTTMPKLQHPYYFMDTVIVLATCAFADYGSWLQGSEHQYQSVRGTSYSDPFGQWFASEMQFNLTAIALIGIRRYTMHLVAVMVIQCNSFLMTMRRRLVASHEVLTAAYGGLLLFAFFEGIMDDDYSEMMLPAGTYGSLATILRMGPLRLNKYLLWTLLGLSLYMIRTYELVQVTNNDFWMAAFVVTKAIATALGLMKRSGEIKEGQDAKMVYCVLLSYAFLGAYIFYWRFIAEEE